MGKTDFARYGVEKTKQKHEHAFNLFASVQTYQT